MKASNVFFLALFWAIGLVCIVKNVWILELLTIPFGIYLIKKLLAWIGTDTVLYTHLDSAKLKLKLWAKERKDVLAPAPVRGIMRTVLLGDKKVSDHLSTSLRGTIEILDKACVHGHENNVPKTNYKIAKR